MMGVLVRVLIQDSFLIAMLSNGIPETQIPGEPFQKNVFRCESADIPKYIWRFSVFLHWTDPTER